MNSIEIIDGENYLRIGEDAQSFEGNANSITLNDYNIASFLYYFLNKDTIDALSTYNDNELLITFVNKLKSMRRNSSAVRAAIFDIYFREYIQCSSDVQSLHVAEAERYLKIDIPDYVITKLTIDEYIESHEEILLTTYETLHDQLLFKLDFFKEFEISIEDDAVEIWEDYDEYVVIDWERLEKDVAMKFNNDDLSIYAIRKVRKEISRYKNISTNSMRYFRPLKDSYERQYYKLKGTEDATEETN